MNRAFCGTCGALAPAEIETRDNQVYLVKACEKCGRTEALISSDAKRYHVKRHLDGDVNPTGVCHIDCLNCGVWSAKRPILVFVDVTNRCNLNCPICMNNTPSMGFLFEPPIEYFDEIFKHYAQFDPKPVMQLFGGEPTVLDNLLEIIDLAKSYGLAVRIVTNGIKLADMDYCKALAKRRVTLLLSYDGANPETYRGMRNTTKILDLKHKAIDNFASIPKTKMIIMSLVAKGVNDEELPELFQYCHDRRQTIRGIYFMPLAHCWDKEDYDYEPPRITTEDVEVITDNAFPDDRIDFAPAGFPSQLPHLMKYFNVPPLPFSGAHPNCESMYTLISNGETYVPVARFLKGTIPEVGEDLMTVEKQLAAMDSSNGNAASFGVRMRTHLKIARLVLRRVKFNYLLKGKGPGKVWHALMIPFALLSGKKFRHAMAPHVNAQGALQVLVLPYEDRQNIEADRLERCPTGFVYYDPDDGKVKRCPVCTWQLFKTDVMRRIANHYGTAKIERQTVPID